MAGKTSAALALSPARQAGVHAVGLRTLKKWCVRSVMLRRWTEGHRGYSPVVLFRRLLTREMVDRHGFAPCSPACGAGDLLNDRAAQENGSGGRIRTGAFAAYEAAAFPLGYPAVLEIGTASRCRPEPVRFWRPNCARWRPPCKFVWFEIWCGQPESHRHPLIGTQTSCS
jgi:hypothetical protein